MNKLVNRSIIAVAIIAAGSIEIRGAYSALTASQVTNFSLFLTTSNQNTQSFVYDSSTNRLYGATQDASGQKGIWVIENVNKNGVSFSDAKTIFTPEQWTYAYLDADNISGSLSNPLLLNQQRAGQAYPGGLLINPKDILRSDGSVAYAANGNLWLTSLSGTVKDNNVSREDLTSRVVTFSASAVYDVLHSSSASALQSSLTTGTQYIDTVVTKAQYNAAAGVAAGKTDNNGRQYGWSSNGQSLYFFDSNLSAGFGGLYKISNLGNTPTVTKLTTGSAMNEVFVKNVNGTDRIYSYDTPSDTEDQAKSTTQGLIYYTDNGSTADRHLGISYSNLASFLESSKLYAPKVSAGVVDGDGNVYYNIQYKTSLDANAVTNAILLREDANGNLSKVSTLDERKAFNPLEVRGNLLKLQFIPGVDFTNADGVATQVNKLIFLGSTGLGSLLVFNPTDFNRDGIENNGDLGLLRSAAQQLGSATSIDSLDTRFDLNGNGLFTFKDIKIAQQFLKFSDADANLDGVVDGLDFDALANHWLGAGGWIGGDFNNDGIVDGLDFDILTNNWLAVTPETIASLSLQLGLTAVPEPATLLTFALGGAVLLTRRLKNKH